MRLGIKARYVDAEPLAKLGTDLMEIYVAERDLWDHQDEMERTFNRISHDQGIELVVHSQAYFIDSGNYHLLDLASHDEGIRKKSKSIVNKTLNFASMINASYVIVHPGGINPNKIDGEILLTTLTKSLKEIGDERILVENMPWFYIMRNQEIWRSNICKRADDFFRFLDFVGGLTLDICHAYLTTKEGGNHYIERMKNDLRDQIKHVHVSDAKPPHHEGLQIGEGLVDFTLLGDFNVGIVPEIMGGHENNGEGFLEAIKRLRHYE
jgi:sugar phosphate isomerase/epimerase